MLLLLGSDFQMDDEYSFNPQVAIFAVIAIIILVAIFFPYGSIEKKPAVVENKSTAIQIEYITVMVTPTPDGKLYYANEFDPGIRKIQNPFSFYRDNASGQKALRVTSMVYDYKIFNYITWHNPSDQKDYTMYPNDGMRFLFVFYAMYLDDRIADDTRFNIPSPNNYVVQSIKDKSTYLPLVYPEQLRFLELEYAKTMDNKEQAQYFGQHREYTRNSDAKDTAGEISVKDTVLRGGKSNMMSGYILYEVPRYLEPEDMIAGINFYSWGSPWWRLKPE